MAHARGHHNLRAYMFVFVVALALRRSRAAAAVRAYEPRSKWNLRLKQKRNRRALVPNIEIDRIHCLLHRKSQSRLREVDVCNREMVPLRGQMRAKDNSALGPVQIEAQQPTHRGIEKSGWRPCLFRH